MQNPNLPANQALAAHHLLLAFFGIPEWRNPLPAMDELVSTILSQNTNDLNRDRAFDALCMKFPNWESVRDADTHAVIEAIRPAGLAEQKGPRIQTILKQITEIRGELSLEFLREYVPEDARQWLLQFKGVGPKTAAIVMLFSLNLPAFPVDTHIYRVTQRVGLTPQKMTPDQAHDHLADLLPKDTYYTAHLNFIRLGRTICLARRPKCTLCPLQNLCDYNQNINPNQPVNP